MHIIPSMESPCRNRYGVAFVGSVGGYDFSLRKRRLEGVYSDSDYRAGIFPEEAARQNGLSWHYAGD